MFKPAVAFFPPHFFFFFFLVFVFIFLTSNDTKYFKILTTYFLYWLSYFNCNVHLLFQQNVKMNLKVVLQLPVTPLWPSQQLPGEDPLIHWLFGYSLSTCHIADIFSSLEKVQIWIKMAQVSDTWSLHLSKKGGKWAEKIN